MSDVQTTPEKELGVAFLVSGTNRSGCYSYEIHKVEYADIEQYRLRFRSSRHKFKVMFARSPQELVNQAKALSWV
ncbi:hypothetical protein WKH82_17415 [Acinetobacter baumannii]|nr:hypothetical protein [Acinetobacter baumannii]